MIIVKLVGGLGNQMFQYAAGRRLSYMHNTELKFDFQGMNEGTKRSYELGVFNIKEKFATSLEIAKIKFKKRKILNKIADKIFHIPPIYSTTYIKEKHFHFDPEILNLLDGVYLDGFWQSENYFKDIMGIIRTEFTIKTPQTKKNKELSEIIKLHNSVSIHFRRGDYVSNTKNNIKHGTCELDYYERCIQIITQKIYNPYFILFSDDPQWVSTNFKIKNQLNLINHNRAEFAYEDLRLMSQCKHHIIANSSFSWWGAWLNPNPNKIILTPKEWFRTTKLDVRDLIPPNWIKI